VKYFGRWDYGEWREILSTGVSSAEGESIRRATHTGEPLGSGEFVAALEKQAGRRLRVLARGRPPRKSEERRGPAGMATGSRAAVEMDVNRKMRLSPFR
jgi:hypothetical protein